MVTFSSTWGTPVTSGVELLYNLKLPIHNIYISKRVDLKDKSP